MQPAQEVYYVQYMQKENSVQVPFYETVQRMEMRFCLGKCKKARRTSMCRGVPEKAGEEGCVGQSSTARVQRARALRAAQTKDVVR